ncbi:MAG: cupin domain-containing protein [Burkholderiales bacterium]
MSPSSQATVFRYATPDAERSKTVVKLCRSDILYSNVQVITSGGENNMHSHPAQDGFWFVLRGKVRFYGENDAVIAELGRHEGVMIPRGLPYWFESSSDEVLELLQVESIDKSVKNVRIDYEPQKTATLEADFRNSGSPTP